MKAFIGIDPGQTGAIALLDDGFAGVWDWPGDERVAAQIMKELHFDSEIGLVVIEEQRGMPNQSSSTVFKLAQNYGVWLGMAACLRWPVQIAKVKDWRKGLDYPSKKPGTKTAKHRSNLKKHSLTVARRLFPQCASQLSRVKDDGRAEALLIARYAKSIYES